MTSTKKLLITFLTITLLLILYIFYIKFDVIMKKISDVYNSFKVSEVIIPDKDYYTRNYKFITFKDTTNFKPENENDIKNIYYTVLDKGWKNFTFYCTKDYTTCVSDVKKIANDNDFITLINNYVNPYNSFKNYNTLITGDNEVNLKIETLYNENEIKEIDTIINNIISDLNINVKSPPKRNIKSLHDYLLKHITYDNKYKDGDNTSLSNKGNGALIKKVARCSKYPDTFTIMMDKLNIPNFKITSKDHVWNVIYFDNTWSHIDVTWDDDELNLNNNSNFFMISTEKLLSVDKKEHSFDTNIYKELK